MPWARTPRKADGLGDVIAIVNRVEVATCTRITNESSSVKVKGVCGDHITDSESDVITIRLLGQRAWKSQSRRDRPSHRSSRFRR